MTSPHFPIAIDSTTPCKLWLGAVSDDGYGVGQKSFVFRELRFTTYEQNVRGETCHD